MGPIKSNVEWPLPFVAPEKVGISSNKLSNIRPKLQEFIDRKFAPNLVTLIARHGKVVFYQAQGYMDFESKKPAKIDTIYRLWSNTKPITGVATMLCVEDGLLSLDDPVSKFIPAFRNQRVRVPGAQGPMIGTPTVPVIGDITVRDCLRNTTGLTTARRAPLSYLAEFKDIIPKAGILGSPAAAHNIRETLDALAQLPLESQPGTQFEYQVGYPVVGVVLETVTGQTLEEFYQKRIFQPLGMRDSSFYLEKNKLDRFPTLYSVAQDKGKWKLVVNEVPSKSEKFLGPKTYFEAGGGGGGVLSTAADYARLAQMLLNKGELEGVRILSRRSVEMMTSNHTGNVNLNMSNPGLCFGMGVGVYQGSNPPIYRSVGTFGWSGAAGTTFFVDPKEDIFAICFSQVFMHEVMPGNSYQEEFERLVYESLI
jgi:CubicO group peptidase (beta-lactamase class C family)